MIFLQMVLVFLLNSTFAQDAVDMNIVESSTADNPASAKNEIVQKAMQSAALQQVIGILGQEQYNSKKDAVKQNILKKTNLFIPFYSTGNLNESPEGYKMDVNLKVSVASLRNLLLSSGILYNNTGTPMLMPFIALRDMIQSQSYSWWEEGSQSIILNQLAGEVENIMYSAVSPQGFYLVRPVTFKYKNKIASSSFSSVLNQMKGWAQNEGAQIYLVGEIMFLNDSAKSGATRAKLRYTAYQTSTGKEIGEVVRSLGDIQGGFEVGLKTKVKDLIKTSSEDLVSLIKDNWQRGTFEAKQVKLAITGDLSYKELNNIKKFLQTNLKEIKDMNEKLVEPGRITFNLDYDGDVNTLGQKMKSLNPQGFSAQLVTAGSNEIVWDLKRL